MLDVYQILDVQSGGNIQWRRKDFTIRELKRWSRNPYDYVMDSERYSSLELTEVQQHDLEHKKRTGASAIRWSCKGHRGHI